MLNRFQGWWTAGTSWLEAHGSAIAGIMLILYFAYQLSAGWIKADNYLFGKRDSAIYQSAMWQAGQGINPKTYAMPGLQTYTLTGLHFMPAGFVYGLAYRVFPTVHTTLVIYALSFLAAGFCVYKLSETITHSRAWSTLLLMVYLTCYTPGIDHFYFEDWATPFIAAAMWQWARRNYQASSIWWIGAAMFKEYIILIPVALGLWSVLAARRPIAWGTIWVTAGSIWFGVAYFGIMRFFEPTPINLFTVGNPYADLPTIALQTPLQIWVTTFSPENGNYLLGLLAPLVFLPLLGWEASLGSLPILMINLLGGSRTFGPTGHYTTFMLPVFLTAAALGLQRVLNWQGRLQYVLKILVAAGLLIASLIGMRYHFYKWRESLVATQVAHAHTQDVQTIFALIPPTAHMAADEPLMPFLSNRMVISHLDNISFTKPDWIVRDSFYEAYPHLLQQGFALGWRVAQTPSTDFQLPAAPTTSFPGYHIVAQQGTLVLWSKAP